MLELGLLVGVVVGFGDKLLGFDGRGEDVVLDDGAAIGVFDFLEEGVGFEARTEVADFDDEVGLVEDDIDACARMFAAELVFHGESLRAGVGTREFGDADAIARNGLDALVELDVLLDHLLDFDVACDFVSALVDGRFLRRGADAGGESDGEYDDFTEVHWRGLF